MTASEFAVMVPEFSPRIWTRGTQKRVYLTPPGWKKDAGYVDFSGATPRIVFSMDAADAARVRAVLGK